MTDNDNTEHDETHVSDLNDCFFAEDAVFYDTDFEAFYTFTRDVDENEVVYHDLDGDEVERFDAEGFKHTQDLLYPVDADAVADPVQFVEDTIEDVNSTMNHDVAFEYASQRATVVHEDDTLSEGDVEVVRRVLRDLVAFERDRLLGYAPEDLHKNPRDVLDRSERALCLLGDDPDDVVWPDDQRKLGLGWGEHDD